MIRRDYEAGLGVQVSGVVGAIIDTGAIAAVGFAELPVELQGSGGVYLDAIGAGATLKIDSGIASDQTVDFAATTGGDLNLNDAIVRVLRFQGAVMDFRGADEIHLWTFKFSAAPTAAWSQTGASGVLTVTDGVKATRMALFRQFSAAGFTVAATTELARRSAMPRPGGR